METGTFLLKEFESTYSKKTKHRKKCKICGRLIQDGERVIMAQIKKVKYYPVKGLMGFTSWVFKHVNCKEEKMQKSFSVGEVSEGKISDIVLAFAPTLGMEFTCDYIDGRAMINGVWDNNAVSWIDEQDHAVKLSWDRFCENVKNGEYVIVESNEGIDLNGHTI